MSALVTFRERRHPYFCPHLADNLVAFFYGYGIRMDIEDVKDFWTWFCVSSSFAKDGIRNITTYTPEEILWGVERFIEEFSPLDADFENRDDED